MNKMPLGKLGTYTLERVLIEYEYPILFVCQNEKGRLLLFVEMDSNNLFEKWVAVDTNTKILNSLYRKNITIQRSFLSPDVNKYYVVTHDYISDEYTFIISDRMPDNVLNSGDDYLIIDQDYGDILNAAKETYLRNGSPVLDFHLNPYSHKHAISASLLASITNKVSTCYNYSTNNRGDNLMVEFQPASFVLRFYSKSKKESVLPSETTEAAFNTICNILGSSDIESIADNLIQTPKLVKPVKELMGSLAKEKEDFDVFVTSDTNTKPTIKSINIDQLSKVNKKLKEYTIVNETKDKEVKGELLAYSSVKRTFTFLVDNSECIEGFWEKNFVDEHYTIHKKYIATLNIVEEKYNIKNAQTKKKYKLISLVPID